MSKDINIRKGLDIKLVGIAEKVLVKAPSAKTYALCPDNYVGVKPKMLVKVDDKVKAGTPLFFDKENPEILFTSPVSGTVAEIRRADKRKILAVIIAADDANEAEQLDVIEPKTATKQQAKDLLLKSGLWTALIQRPFGIIANPKDEPRDIFISALDTAPLGVDMDFILQDQQQNLTAGIELLAKLTEGEVYLSIGQDATAGALPKIKNAKISIFKGKHPAGNVGTQIAKIKPIAKGDIVWTIDPSHVVMIGKLALTGIPNFEKTIAVAGSQIKKTSYAKIVSGAQIESFTNNNIEGDNYRLISGNPLTGVKVETDGYVGFYHNVVSAIPEGDYYEFVGWAMPRLGKFSTSRSYASFLTPNKKFDLDTNLNGGERAFVLNGIYDKVTPLDIYPVYLIKAVIAGDIDKMEQLGIYEVIEEDLALCEFICPSKIEWQSILRQGINQLIKEI